MLAWAVGSEGAPILGALSFLLTAIGIPIALWGLRLTYVQARTARDAAQNASSAIAAFRIRVDHYSAYRDVGEASSAIDHTRRHLMNNSWDDACDSYETAYRAILRVRKSSVKFSPRLRVELDKMADHMRRFCDRIDTARAEKGEYPDKAKVLIAIRQNHEILTEASASLELEVGGHE